MAPVFCSVIWLAISRLLGMFSYSWLFSVFHLCVIESCYFVRGLSSFFSLFASIENVFSSVFLILFPSISVASFNVKNVVIIFHLYVLISCKKPSQYKERLASQKPSLTLFSLIAYASFFTMKVQTKITIHLLQSILHPWVGDLAPNRLSLAWLSRNWTRRYFLAIDV